MHGEEDDDPGGSVAGVWAETAPAAPKDRHPFAIASADRYQRGGLLGRGGMGNVYSARDRRLNREVALKEVTVSSGASGQGRLAQEAWITAQLEHPNIVPVHDAGTDADGIPWYTMRLIRGRTLHEVLDGADRATRLGTLRHILAACEAVAYAHSRGIVHRDLKPENILVGSFGETQVADWGLARPLDGAAEDWSDIVPSGHVSATMIGAAVGTPAWMSPEQLRGEAATRRSDVWSLGAVLRQVVTGQAPWSGLDNSQILSERISSEDRALQGPLAGPDVLAARTELEAIIRRAMAADPALRYADAAELSADLARYLDGRRVHAHEYSAFDLLRRLATLWRAPLVVGVLASLALAAAVGVGWSRTSAARQRAQHNLALALLHQARAAESAGDRPSAELLAGEVLAIEESPAARGVLAAFSGTARPRVEITPLAGAGCDASRLLGPQTWVCVREDALIAYRIGAQEPLWTQSPGPMFEVITPGNGELFVSIGEGTLLQLEPGTGETVRALPTPGFPQHVVRSDNGRFLAAWRVRDLLLWDLTTEGVTPINGCDSAGGVAAAAFGVDSLLVLCGDLRLGRVDLEAPEPDRFEATLPDGLWSGGGPLAVAHLGADVFAITTHQGELAVYDAVAGALRQTVEVAEHGLYDVIVGPSRRRLAIRGERGDVHLLEIGADYATPLPTRDARDIRFEPDGSLIVLTDAWQRWTLPPREAPRRVNAGAGLTTVRVSPDGQTIAGATGQGNMVLWGPEEATLRTVPLFAGVIKDAAFAHDGASVLAVASVPDPMTARRVRLADLAVSDGTLTVGVRRGALLRDGSFVSLSYGGGGPLHAPDLSSPVRGLGWSEDPMWDLAVDDAGDKVVVIGEDQQVRFAELVEGGLVQRWTAAVEGGRWVDVHRSGRVAVTRPDAVRLFEAGGAIGLTLRADALQLTDVAFSPDGDTLAAGDLSGAIWIWDRTDGRLLAELRGHSTRVSGLAFRGEDELVSGSWDGTMRRWDLGPLRRGATALRADSASWKRTLTDVLDIPELTIDGR